MREGDELVRAEMVTKPDALLMIHAASGKLWAIGDITISLWKLLDNKSMLRGASGFDSGRAYPLPTLCILYVRFVSSVISFTISQPQPRRSIAYDARRGNGQ